MSSSVEIELRVWHDVPDDAPDEIEPHELKVTAVDLDANVIWAYVADPRVAAVREQLDAWNRLSKGESPTTKRIRELLEGRR